ncbi:MAG: cysteine desulfurase-like protein [Gemmatimonadetes bacterium]|nr:cysteine desulfurase-like protein [Gemmatimonadota bacterium]
MNDQTLTERIRKDFPALTREMAGQHPAYFDGPAGSQVPRQVIEAITEYLGTHNANTGGSFATSRETDQIIESARDRVAGFLGAPNPSNVVFGANMTTLTFSISRSLKRRWSAGDEIIVTDLDHQANVAPWRMAAEEAGARVKVVPFHRESCTLDFEALETLLTPRTKLVAVGLASNAVGTVTDAARVVSLAKQVGALSYVDAVHFAPHGLIDVAAIGCDFLTCSAYKFFGPHVGILWGKEEHLSELTPYKVPPASDSSPGRWETGTLNHAGIAGTGAAVEWIASLGGNTGELRDRIAAGMRTIHEVEDPLLQQLLTGLRSIPGVSVYGPPSGHPRTPTIAFTSEAEQAGLLAERLAREAIFVWAGDFYAPTVIDRLGLRERGGVVRVGLAPYNTAAEVDRLLGCVTERKTGR